MTRLGRLLRAVPLGLGGLVVAAGSLLLMANLALLGLGFGPMKLAPRLDGVTKPETIPWSQAAVLHGQTQAAVAHTVGAAMPLYQNAVRLRNQAFYSLLGVSPVPSVLIGRDGELLELPYVEDWCSRRIAQWRPGALAWAASIRRMQDTVEAHGHSFLYLLTPSKVAQNPGFVPPDYTCPAKPADQFGLVPEWVAMLRQAGVHVADTTAALAAARPSYPFALYPPGGTHWNAVGEAIGMEQVMAQLDRLRPGQGYEPFRFTWRLDKQARGQDVDLARLVNLFTHPWAVPVPAITLIPAAPPPQCQPQSVVVVGGSFGHIVPMLQAAMTCHPSVVEYEYWHVTEVTLAGTEFRFRDVDPVRRDAAVLGADVLIYEENEQVLRNPETGRALFALLERTAGAQSSAPPNE